MTRQVAVERVLDRKFLFRSVLGLVVLGATIFGVHRWQVYRLSHALREEARHSRETANFGREARLLHSYLQLHPNEPDVLAELAVATDQAGSTLANRNSAIQWYTRSLGHLPSRLDLRTRLSELLLLVGRVSESLHESRVALQQDSNHVPALRVQALALHRDAENSGSLDRLENATTALETAVQHLPSDQELIAALVDTYEARMQQGEDHAARCITLLDQLVDSAHDARSYLLRAGYRLRHQLPGLSDDLQSAIQAGPPDHAAWLAIALHAHHAGEWAVAEPAYQRAAELAPQDGQAQQGWGDCQRQAGQIERALQTWQAGVEKSLEPPLGLLYRIAEAHLDLDQLAEARQVLDRAAQLLERLPSLPENRAQRSEWRSMAQLLEGRWLMTQGRCNEAETHIVAAVKEEPLSSDTFNWERRQRAALWTLGQLQEKLGRGAAAELTYERLGRAFPVDQPRARWAATLALTTVGEVDRALDVCQRLVQDPQAPPETSLLQVALQLEQVAQQLPPLRTWQTIEQNLSAIDPQATQPWKVALLKAQSQVLQQGVVSPQITAMLQNHEQGWLHNAEAWSHLALFYARLGQPEAAEKAAERYAMLINQPVEGLLFRALLALQQADPAQAQQHLSRLPVDQQLSKVDALAELTLQRDIQCQRGDWSAEQRLQEQLIERAPHDPRHLRQLAQRTWEQGLPLDDVCQRIVALEGAHSPFALVTQIRLWLRQQSGVVPTDLPADVEEWLTHLERECPHWPLREVLLGEVAERQGERLSAAEHYLAAAGQGYLPTLHRLHALRNLLVEPTWPAALALLEKTAWSQWPGMIPADLELVASPREQLWRAYRAARRDWEANRDNVPAIHWLLVVHSLLQSPGMALPADEPRLEVGPLASPLSHDPLVQWLLAYRNGVSRERRADDPTGGPWAAEMALLAGDRSAAADMYQALADEPAAWPAAIRYLTLVPHGAPELAQSLLQLPPARRVAGLLVTTPSSAPSPSVPLPAPVLNGTPQRAMTQLSQHELEQARTLEQQGQLLEARTVYEQIIAQDPDPAHRGAFARFLVRQQAWDEVAQQVTALQQVAPDNWETVRAEALLWNYQGKTAQALERLRGLELARVDPSDDPLVAGQALVELAQIYGEIGQGDERQRLFKLLGKQAPFQIPGLAMSLATAGEWNHATELCLAAVDTEYDYVAVVALAKMAELAVPPAVLEQVILPQVEAKLARYGDRPEFLFHVSNIRMRQLNFDEAVRLLRRVTDLDPNHVIAWNNLAALLAEVPASQDEAERCIERAMTITREPLTTVLDTRAVVHLHRGQLEPALTLLERVTESPEGDDPRYYFHLAWLLKLRHDPAGARLALEKSEELGLSSRYLTHVERQWLEQMRAEIEF